MKFEQLQKSSQQAYECLGKAKDARFERAWALMSVPMYEHQPTASPHGIAVGIAQGYI
jgi:hypothetical protein